MPVEKLFNINYWYCNISLKIDQGLRSSIFSEKNFFCTVPITSNNCLHVLSSITNIKHQEEMKQSCFLVPNETFYCGKSTSLKVKCISYIKAPAKSAGYRLIEANFIENVWLVSERWSQPCLRTLCKSTASLKDTMAAFRITDSEYIPNGTPPKLEWDLPFIRHKYDIVINHSVSSSLYVLKR